MFIEIPLPNLGLRIYTTRNYLIGLQPSPLNRSTSARHVNAPCITTEKIQHQGWHTLINQAHQGNITNGHPHHHTILKDLPKILRRGTEDQDRKILSPDVDRPGPSHRHQDPPRHSVSSKEGQLAHLNLQIDTISEEQANISQTLIE